MPLDAGSPLKEQSETTIDPSEVLHVIENDPPRLVQLLNVNFPRPDGPSTVIFASSANSQPSNKYSPSEIVARSMVTFFRMSPLATNLPVLMTRDCA